MLVGLLKNARKEERGEVAGMLVHQSRDSFFFWDCFQNGAGGPAQRFEPGREGEVRWECGIIGDVLFRARRDSEVLHGGNGGVCAREFSSRGRRAAPGNR